MLHLRETMNEVEADVDLPALLASFPPAAKAASAPASASGTGIIARSGLCPDAMIETPDGPRPASSLGAGDMVLTHDRGAQPLLWTGSTASDRDRRNPAVRLQAATVTGADQRGSLRLASDTLVLLRHPLNDLFFGVDTVLCPAGALRDGAGVKPAPMPGGAWSLLLFAAHEVICADGVWVESLAPDMDLIQTGDPDLAAQIRLAVPRLSFHHGRAAYVTTRPVLNRREAQLLNLS